MSDGHLFLGVDGGGTKTEFACIDADGRLLAQALTGPTYYLQVGLDGVVRALEEGIGQITAALSVTASDFDHVFFGLPAYGEDSVIDPKLHDLCGRILGHARYGCGNDMICGWAGSLACADGINLVAGTGSIAYGERAGNGARAGGWGEIFGDEGSAYWIAIQGLNAFTRMSDGRLPIGALHGLLVEALELHEDLDLCARIMGERAMARDEIAALSTIVARAADDGDLAAAGILDRAAQELSHMARALREKLGFATTDIVPLSWSGGVLAHNASLRTSLGRHLLTDGGRFQLTEPRHSPAYGAALYAARLGEARTEA
jgi:N-acetylglucosamine kinase-like BadF-type ATPase